MLRDAYPLSARSDPTRTEEGTGQGKQHRPGRQVANTTGVSNDLARRQLSNRLVDRTSPLSSASVMLYDMSAKRVWLRRVALLVATGSVTVIVVIWLFIRADLQTLRVAIRASAAQDVPANVINAFTAAEDPCHWKHGRAYTLSTVIGMFFATDGGEGAAGHASLANQLVRQHMNGRGISRTVRELLITAALEVTENPATVIRAYANSVYLGAAGGKQIYGVTEAGDIYYGKRPSQLALTDCVALAASIKSPQIYSTHMQSDRAVDRRVTVLGRLRALGFVSQQEFTSAESKLRNTAG